MTEIGAWRKVEIAVVAAVVVFICESVLPVAWSSVKVALRKLTRVLKNAEEEEEAVEDKVLTALAEAATTAPAATATVQKPTEPVVAKPVAEIVEPPVVRRVREEFVIADDEFADMTAEELWNTVRKMSHNFVPMPSSDHDYLKLMARAARKGHVEAMKKLSEYAARRGALVEAYYWLTVASLHGVNNLSKQIGEVRGMWLARGCMPEYENVRSDFSETQGSFARAVLRLQCAMNTPVARKRIQELAGMGCEEAKLFLASGKAR